MCFIYPWNLTCPPSADPFALWWTSKGVALIVATNASGIVGGADGISVLIVILGAVAAALLWSRRLPRKRPSRQSNRAL